MKAYKLTDQNGRTRNETQWGEGVSHTATGDSKCLCSNGWIHFYTHPLIAVLLNPIHAAFNAPKLWECETSGEECHEPLKSGCKTLTTIREISLPEISTTQRIAFGILCAKKIYKDPKWNEWADNWLSGEDRSKAAAVAAASASAAAAYAAADAADADAADAAAAAADAAASASASAAAAYAAAAVAAAVAAASAAVAAADADAYAAASAADANTPINFIDFAEKAMTYK